MSAGAWTMLAGALGLVAWLALGAVR